MNKHTKMMELIQQDYQRKVQLFQQDTQSYDVVFCGDSMFGFMNTKRYFPDLSVMNQGISGDTTTGLMKRMQYVISKNPKIIVMNIGSNDLVLTHLSYVEIIAHILWMKQRIESQLEHVSVLICTITPVLDHHEISNQDYIFGRTNQAIEALNKLIKSNINSSEIIDLHGLFADEQGNLMLKYTKDGIHLNHEGYLVFSEYLKKYIL